MLFLLNCYFLFKYISAKYGFIILYIDSVIKNIVLYSTQAWLKSLGINKKSVLNSMYNYFVKLSMCYVHFLSHNESSNVKEPLSIISQMRTLEIHMRSF